MYIYIYVHLCMFFAMLCFNIFVCSPFSFNSQFVGLAVAVMSVKKRRKVDLFEETQVEETQVEFSPDSELEEVESEGPEEWLQKESYLEEFSKVLAGYNEAIPNNDYTLQVKEELAKLAFDSVMLSSFYTAKLKGTTTDVVHPTSLRDVLDRWSEVKKTARLMRQDKEEKRDA